MSTRAVGLTTVWSPKGGSGVTVVAAALAVARARSGDPVLLVDMGGDLPSALGVAAPSGPGAHDWLSDEHADASSLSRLVVPVTDGLSLLHTGRSATGGWSLQRAEAFVAALVAGSAGSEGRATTVIIDAGICAGPTARQDHVELVARLAASGRSLMVIRACYLALRSAMSVSLAADGVVLVSEPGRSLGERDVSDVLSLPVLAVVAADPAIARSVDAGLLTRRTPPSLSRELAALW